jgi:hypothetical protein
VLSPRARRVVGSRGGGIDATIGVETHACELAESVGMPVKRQLRSVIEAVAVVIGSAGQRLHGPVEVLEDFLPVLAAADTHGLSWPWPRCNCSGTAGLGWAGVGFCFQGVVS